MRLSSTSATHQRHSWRTEFLIRSAQRTVIIRPGDRNTQLALLLILMEKEVPRWSATVRAALHPKCCDATSDHRPRRFTPPNHLNLPASAAHRCRGCTPAAASHLRGRICAAKHFIPNPTWANAQTGRVRSRLCRASTRVAQHRGRGARGAAWHAPQAPTAARHDVEIVRTDSVHAEPSAPPVRACAPALMQLCTRRSAVYSHTRRLCSPPLLRCDRAARRSRPGPAALCGSASVTTPV